MKDASGQLLGMANRFVVKIDQGGFDLGSWSKVGGLDVTWDVGEYRAGDDWNNRWFSVGATKYSPITLERAACDDTVTVKKWLDETALKPAYYSGAIVLLDATSVEVFQWTLRNIIPMKWSIAGFEAGASKVALETLQIQHLGFLTDDRKPGEYGKKDQAAAAG
ncbi:phage tail protein [Lentzea sp. NPDC059081]|uniref:phage tail protein n=1 Tax=Lentzea sp. NPDC059081 TaxID=3346719 RepID=UPI0036904A25